ncbi:MAG: T9SS type A sorting domain-containing protein, partial [candidate division WOR-3 bacterium]|nr:T9SS type A sorting domain-containing protein [candidate division WOR-3 bacterium]
DVYLIKTDIEGNKLWDKTFSLFSEDYKDEAYCVRQTSDGGYIVTGHHESSYEGATRIYLIKTDSAGDTLWTRTYANIWPVSFCVQQTSDGGYIILGATSPEELWLLKTDEHGDTLWTTAWGVFGACVREAPDGGYIITGSSFTEEYGYELLVSKINCTGRVVWVREYGGEGLQKGASLQLTSDGGYIITGDIGSNVGLLKTDVDGDSLWTRVYRMGAEELATRSNCVQETSDGGYIISGITNWSFGIAPCDLFILKTDSVGDSLWAHIYGGTNRRFRTSICQTPDGGYIIAGTKGCSDSTSVAWLLKTDEQGDTLWTRTFGSAWNRDDGNCVQVTSDSGYIITGCTESYSHDTSVDVLLIKTDSLGEVGGIEEEPVRESVIRLEASLNRLFYDVSGQASLTIYSVDGRKVLEETIKGEGIWTPSPPSSLPSGVYFARVTTEGYSARTKIVILR